MALDRNAAADRTRIADSVLLISQHPEGKELLKEFLTYFLVGSKGVVVGRRDANPKAPGGVVVCESQLSDSTWEQLLSSLARLADPPPLIVISRLADER
jgi:hypothetical protein